MVGTKNRKYKAELDALKRPFVEQYGLREFKWGLRNVKSLFGMGGADSEAVNKAVDQVFRGGRYGLLEDSHVAGHLFDHCECYGRDGRPLFLIGFPYQLNRDAIKALSLMADLGLDVRVDGRSWYGYGTVLVMVTHWDSVREVGESVQQRNLVAQHA